MGYADLKADAGLATNNDRVRARGTLLPELRQRLALHTAEELSAIFERHGLPFAPIMRPEQLFDDPHLNATGGLADITLPDGERAGETARVTLMPLRMDGQRMAVRTDPPRLGQHTAELLAGLGYTPAQVQALHAASAVA
jgi:crotonobetainyl-CoA:carnitine CoA-transferase CaiB-like acyl-CoA transferase